MDVSLYRPGTAEEVLAECKASLNSLKVLKTCDFWLIAADSDLITALEALKDPTVCPEIVHFVKTEFGVNARTCDFLYSISRRETKIRVTSDNFSSPSSQVSHSTLKFIQHVLKECSSSEARCTLDELWGPLQSTDVASLPSTGMNRLGLVLAADGDLAAYREVVGRLEARSLQLRELHLSVVLNLTELVARQLTGYCPVRLCLHYARVSGNSLDAMMNITRALDKPFTANHVGVDALYLPESSLNVEDVRRLHLLMESRGTAPAPVKYTVYVESTSMHEAAKQDLIKDFKAINCSIKFSVRTRQPESSTHGIQSRIGEVGLKKLRANNGYGSWASCCRLAQEVFRVAAKGFRALAAKCQAAEESAHMILLFVLPLLFMCFSVFMFSICSVLYYHIRVA